jgi:hypothetical protein
MNYMRKTTRYTWPDYKTSRGIAKERYNPRFGQNTGIQKKLVATYNQNAPY